MPLLAPALEVLSCLLAVARHLGWQSAAAFGHSQTVETAGFRRALFMPGADEFLGPQDALAAQMRPQTAQKKPGKLRGS
jgi:hypothetical protein